MLFCAAVAAVQSTYIGSGILAPGILKTGLIAPAAVRTSSFVAIPGAVSVDKRIIGGGILGAAPAVVGPGIYGNGLIANGLYRAAPLGVLSPLGLKGTGIIGYPGIVKTYL